MSLPLENERSELTDVITIPSKSTATHASAFSEVFNLSNQINGYHLLNFKNGIKACWKSFDENIKMYF